MKFLDKYLWVLVVIALMALIGCASTTHYAPWDYGAGKPPDGYR